MLTTQIFACLISGQQISRTRTDGWMASIIKGDRSSIEKLVGAPLLMLNKGSTSCATYYRKNFNHFLVEYADNKPISISITFKKKPLFWGEALEKVGIQNKNLIASYYTGRRGDGHYRFTSKENPYKNWEILYWPEKELIGESDILPRKASVTLYLPNVISL